MMFIFYFLKNQSETKVDNTIVIVIQRKENSKKEKLLKT